MKRWGWVVAAWFVIYSKGGHYDVYDQAPSGNDYEVGRYPTEEIAKDVAEALTEAHDRRTVFIQPQIPPHEITTDKTNYKMRFTTNTDVDDSTMTLPK